MTNEQENINVNSDDSELSYTYNFNVPNVQPVNVTPSTESQQIYAPDGVSGYSPVNISGVNSNIDPNIIPENIKKDVTILGVTGNYSPSSEPAIEELNITPTTSEQTITASGGVDGYSPVNISAVTSSIDSNIQPENIKKDVVILGTTGTFEGSGGIGPAREVSAQGVYQMPTSNFAFNLPADTIDLGDYALYYAFMHCTGLTAVDLTSLTEINGNNALSYAFYGTSLTSVDLSNLVTVAGSEAGAFASCTALASIDLSSLTTVSGRMSSFCSGCSSLISVDLSSLTTVSGSMSQFFENCSSLTTINMSNLTTISGANGFNGIFRGCTSLTTVNFESLATINSDSALYVAFENCSSLKQISFPSLSTITGDRTSAFSNMLEGTTNCTVHFPSNMRSIIYPWVSDFGGTRKTVLFDLPATA